MTFLFLTQDSHMPGTIASFITIKHIITLTLMDKLEEPLNTYKVGANDHDITTSYVIWSWLIQSVLLLAVQKDKISLKHNHTHQVARSRHDKTCFPNFFLVVLQFQLTSMPSHIRTYKVCNNVAMFSRTLLSWDRHKYHCSTHNPLGTLVSETLMAVTVNRSANRLLTAPVFPSPTFPSFVVMP